MADDLVKRLRDVDHLSVVDCFLQSPLYDYAADRIEALERDLALADDQRREWEHHCKTAEAALAAARAALSEIVDAGGQFGGVAYMAKVDRIARKAIALIDGGRNG